MKVKVSDVCGMKEGDTGVFAYHLDHKVLNPRFIYHLTEELRFCQIVNSE